MPNNTPHSDPSTQIAPFVPYTVPQGLGPAQNVGYDFDISQKGTGENYAGAAMGYYGGGNLPSLSSNQQTVFNQYMQTPASAGLDPYYDNAIKKAQSDIDTMSASRGAYGSGAALGLGQRAAVDLRGEQALREADYGLKRLGLGSSIASGADAASTAASADERAWVMGMADLGFSADAAERARAQQIFNAEMGMGGTVEGVMGDEYGAMFADDRALMDAAFAAKMGERTDASSTAYRDVLRKAQEDQAKLDAFLGILETGATAGMAYGA